MLDPRACPGRDILRVGFHGGLLAHKGKPPAREGRKASGLELFGCSLEIAGLPAPRSFGAADTSSNFLCPCSLGRRACAYCRVWVRLSRRLAPAFVRGCWYAFWRWPWWPAVRSVPPALSRTTARPRRACLAVERVTRPILRH